MNASAVDGGRRRFLAAACLLGLILVLRWPALRFLASARPPVGRSPHGEREIGERLVELFQHPTSAQFVGAEYLRRVPGEADHDLLVDLILRSLAGGRSVLMGASKERLRRLLQARTRQDFAEGKTVQLQGWMISLTEGRLCALAAVRHSRA